MSIEELLINIIDDKNYIPIILKNTSKLNMFRKALTLKSYNPDFNYESLETFGDAVLNNLVASYILKYYEYYSIDSLAFYSSVIDRMKGKYILYLIAKELQIDKLIYGSNPSADDLADIIESISYAIYITIDDKKYALYQVYRFLKKYIKSYLEKLDIREISDYGNLSNQIPGLILGKNSIKYNDEILIISNEIKDKVIQDEQKRINTKKAIEILEERNIFTNTLLYNIPSYIKLESYSIKQRDDCFKWIKSFLYVNIDDFLFSLIEDDIYSEDSLILSSITRPGNDVDPGYSPNLNYKFFNGILSPYIVSLSTHTYITKKYKNIIDSNNNKIPSIITSIMIYIRKTIMEKLALKSGIVDIIISTYSIMTNNAIISTFTSILSAIALVINKVICPYGIWYVCSILSLLFEYEIDIHLTLDTLKSYITYIKYIPKITYKYDDNSHSEEDKHFLTYIYINNVLISKGKDVDKRNSKTIAENALIRHIYEEPGNTLLSKLKFNNLDLFIE